MRKFILSIVLATSLVACKQHKPPKNDVVKVAEIDINGRVSQDLNDVINYLKTERGNALDEEQVFNLRAIVAYYDKNNYESIWSNKGVFTKDADSLLTIINNAQDYGLDSTGYHCASLNYISKNNYSVKEKDAALLARADVLLTDAFLQLSQDLKFGKIFPADVDSDNIDLKPVQRENDLMSLLDVVSKAKNIKAFLESREPQFQGYKQLKQALKEFRNKYNGVIWDSVPTGKAAWSDLREKIKQRLIESGDYDTARRVSDSLLLFNAIKTFQKTHGLDTDGVIGKLTIAAMDVPVTMRIQQMEMNLQRWRWERDSLPPSYVWINIPSYYLTVVDSDSVIIQSKVVVGQPDKPTPLLTGRINEMILYPYWTVPFKIATKEILPVLKHDTTYLLRQNMVVLDATNHVVKPSKINWQSYNEHYFPFTIRQLEGSDNALGVVKFSFKNKHSVYLHDTNERQLFAKAYRALSHGCVRMQEYKPLAMYLINDTKNLTVDSLNRCFAKQERRQIKLQNGLPVYIRYFTAEVKDGQLMFYDDVYGYDTAMWDVLSSKEINN